MSVKSWTRNVVASLEDIIENENVTEGEIKSLKETIVVLERLVEDGETECINLENLSKIKSSEPFKVFSITVDGNGNEVEVFEDAYSNLDDARSHKPIHDDWHKIIVYVMEDEAF
ncbi:MAG: hypothetical protein MRZ42_01535 [Tenericutes bacterium]|nr:hypothetical protein [Mycoplasmatota bacterium]